MNSGNLFSSCIDVEAASAAKWVEAGSRLISAAEAEAVILMLGAVRGARADSRNSAGATPNLLDVVATRAKRVPYVVGNRTGWQSAGVFAIAVKVWPRRAASGWLRLDQMEPVR